MFVDPLFRKSFTISHQLIRLSLIRLKKHKLKCKLLDFKNDKFQVGILRDIFNLDLAIKFNKLGLINRNELEIKKS